MSIKAEFIHGTCVALGTRGAILTGPSASGKSDLALRFVCGTPAELDPALIADDQTRIEARGSQLYASAPTTIAGQIEIRGVGIVTLPYRPEAEIALLIELTAPESVPRLPPSPLPCRTLCGIDVPILLLSAFEQSAHLKLRLALQTRVW